MEPKSTLLPLVSWLDFIEKWHNRASDTRFVWFPFEKLRPKKTEQISVVRRALMAVSFGTYCGVFIALRHFLWNQSLSLAATGATTLTVIAAFFLWFNLVTAPLWNRRARRSRLSKGS
jgi:hypothetical protein